MVKDRADIASPRSLDSLCLDSFPSCGPHARIDGCATGALRTISTDRSVTGQHLTEERSQPAQPKLRGQRRISRGPESPIFRPREQSGATSNSSVRVGPRNVTSRFFRSIFSTVASNSTLRVELASPSCVGCISSVSSRSRMPLDAALARCVGIAFPYAISPCPASEIL